MCESARRLAVLASALRDDLASADEDAAPARVMLFTNSAEEAVAAADPLRTALWTEHRLAVLLPMKSERGHEPTPSHAMHACMHRKLHAPYPTEAQPRRCLKPHVYIRMRHSANWVEHQVASVHARQAWKARGRTRGREGAVVFWLPGLCARVLCAALQVVP